MLYTFYTKLTTTTDNNLSYKIMKHPQNEFVRTFQNVDVVGRFTTDGTIINECSYEIFMQHELEEIPNQNKVSWNFVELSALSLRELNVIFNNVLRSGIRGGVDALITQDIVDELHNYSIEFTPVDPGAFLNYEKFTKYTQIATELGIVINYNNETHTVTISTINLMTIKHFLQKSYLMVFSMLAKYSILSQLTKEKVDQLVNMSDEWIEEIATLDLRDYFIRNLMQYKVGLIEKFNNNSVVEVEQNVKLHEFKHDLICDKLNSILSNGIIFDTFKIAEFGCSTGQLAKKLSQCINEEYQSLIDYVGIDSDFKSLEKGKRKLKKHDNYKFVKNDFMNEIVDNAKYVDVALLIEVIEHLDIEEQLILNKLLDFVYTPEYIIISTPNVEYNQFYNLPDGQYRHKDHKIEFNTEQFQSYLDTFFNYNEVHRFEIKSTHETNISPSFMVVLQKCGDVESESFVNWFKERERAKIEQDAAFESPFIIPGFDYIVTSKELRMGRESRAFQQNKDHVFYMGATMAPADIKIKYGRDYEAFAFNYKFLSETIELEHPENAFEYYERKGLNENDLLAEMKYMGSRGYILAFKDESTAAMYGMPVITINSRNGYTFFREDEDLYHLNQHVYNVINESFFNDTVGLDFIMLDCEITPWALKSGNLIYYDFELPVQLQKSGFSKILKSQTFADIVNNSKYLNGYAYCMHFLNTLEHFSNPAEDIKIWVFDVIASGTIKGRKVDLKTNRDNDRRDVNEFLNMHLVENELVNVAQQIVGYENIVNAWNNLDDSHEGLVIKPRRYEFKNGSAILPYMKCRRNSYLSLVYGPYFRAGVKSKVMEKVFWRNIAKKRRLSIFQDELSHTIVKAFFKNDKQLLQKYVAAFYATDAIGNFGGIDMTL